MSKQISLGWWRRGVMLALLLGLAWGAVALAQPMESVSCASNGAEVTQDEKVKDDVLDALSDLPIKYHMAEADLQWVPIDKHFFSCVDGRVSDPLLGAFGGDLGEFVLALTAYQQVKGIELLESSVSKLLKAYLASMDRSKFYHCTDSNAFANLKAAVGDDALNVADPTDVSQKNELLLQLVKPEHVGDVHLRSMLEDASGYGVSKVLLENVMRSYFMTMWNRTESSGSTKLAYSLLYGTPGDEKALVNVIAPSACVGKGLAPLISTSMCETAQVAVVHPSAVVDFRAELANFLADNEDGFAEAILALMNSIGAKWQVKTTKKMLPGYPVYTVQLLERMIA